MAEKKGRYRPEDLFSMRLQGAGFVIGGGNQTSNGGIDMNTKRKIEVFSAGCPACEETIQLVKRVSCPSCEVSVLDMHDSQVAKRAKDLGIHSVPAVVIDGKLADCCAGRGPDESTLRAAGLGQPVA
jgi:glutaredoxin